MPSQPPPRIAVEPGGAPDWMAEAVVEGGGTVVALEDAEAMVWANGGDRAGLAAALERAPGLRWVQLPMAGIERLVDVVDDERVWTCGKGAYAEPVAEMALALGLAGLRGLAHYARTTAWEPQEATNLLGGRVTIVGGGGITVELLRLLAPFGAHVTVVRNRPEPMDGADEVLGSEHLDRALPGADLVVLAPALTPQTLGMIGYDQLSLMESHAWLVNVGRGQHVVTDDLVEALEAGEIGGAALDVTDPEPLPPDHPLRSFPNCLITPHVANTAEMFQPLLAKRVRENVQRYDHDEPLLGQVDPELGY